jgi:hypothetical protein
MERRVALHLGLFTLLITGVGGCGDKITTTPVAPTGPTTLSPLLLPRVDGLWGGPVVLTGIAGGTGAARNAGAIACVGEAFNAVIGETNDNTLSIIQNGANVTAVLASAGTGLTCAYTGRISNNGTNIEDPTPNTLSLTASTCAAPGLTFRCPNGEVHTLQIVGSTITAVTNAPVNVSAIIGTAAHTYNVPGQGALVANHEFTAFTRR